MTSCNCNKQPLFWDHGHSNVPEKRPGCSKRFLQTGSVELCMSNYKQVTNGTKDCKECDFENGPLISLFLRSLADPLQEHLNFGNHFNFGKWVQGCI